MFTKEEYDAFLEVWVKNKKVEDRHQVFADKLGISRSEAKVLAYKIGYSSPIVQAYLKD